MRYLPEDNKNNIELFENYINKVIKPSKSEILKNNPSRFKLRFATRSNSSFIYPYDLIKKFNKYLDIEAVIV